MRTSQAGKSVCESDALARDGPTWKGEMHSDRRSPSDAFSIKRRRALDQKAWVGFQHAGCVTLEHGVGDCAREAIPGMTAGPSAGSSSRSVIRFTNELALGPKAPSVSTAAAAKIARLERNEYFLSLPSSAARAVAACERSAVGTF